MNKDSMSPMCFLDVEHYVVSHNEFGENGFDNSKLDKASSESLIMGLKNNGLEGEDDRALEVILSMGKDKFMSYAKLYSIENALGELVFIPGTTLDRIIDDILFNNDLCGELSISLSFFRNNLEPKLGESISTWAEENEWSGIISEHSINYMNREKLAKASFEAIWMDYDMTFPREVARIIANEYGMDEYHFSQWLNIASYVSGLAQFRNKLVDHVFLDEMECPKNLVSRFPLWNNKVNMIGNLILALDYLNGVEESHFDLSLENKVWGLLDEYSISPARIGFISNNKTNQEAKRA